MKTSSRKTTSTKSKKAATAAPKKKAPPVLRTANYEKAIKDYEDALKLFGRQDFSKAIHLFDALLKEYPSEREICDRARMYIAVSRARTATSGPKPKTADDFYYHGVIAANNGRLEEAAEYFDKVVRQDASSDKAWYAMAALCSLRNDARGATSNLSRAIELNRSNRTQALNDPDFDPMREDAGFMELLGKAPGGGA
ncbi:MAG TPA: tetratricopeptide repeat protein [Candidatus Polarisedimenticolia bacterium]|nr:tetratricopeptide repeat protein [Candidatus Polarisedimenticolia bacterium]